MDAPHEIELKLECDRVALVALKDHPRLKAGRRRPGQRLTSVYFDTEDRRLEKSAVTVRVRKGRGRPIQTVKATGDGLFERPEWELRIAAPGPDLAALAGTPAGALLGDGAELVPLFTVEVMRRVVVVEENGSEIEVALDEGRVFADGQPSEQISEVELELKSGAAGDLFALARELAGATSLRLGVLTKAERGYALANSGDGGRPDAVHADRVALDASMTAAEAFRSVAHSCLRQVRLNEALAEGGSVEALHQLRVGVRRLRSAVSLFGDLVADPQGEKLFEELKRNVEPLGRSRNLDVLTTETMAEERRRRPELTGLLNLEKRFETERSLAKRQAGDALLAEDWRRLALEVVAWVNAGPWLSPSDPARAARLASPIRDFAAETLERRYRQVRKRGKALEEIDDDGRHRLRIAAKKLRYGTEFFAGLYAHGKGAARTEDFLKALRKMQNRLGDLNDLANARAAVEAAAVAEDAGRSDAFAAGIAVADFEARGRGLIGRAAKAYGGLMKARRFWR